MKSAKILIVDDEDITLLSLEAITKAFADVHMATNSEDAISKANELRPDLIILDINLDAKDGFDVKDSISKKYPDIPFIFITTSNNYASQAYEAGAVDFITKPLDLKMAQHRIKNQLERFLSKKALKHANSRINSMVNSLPDAILMTDSEGLVVECNEAAENLTGYQKLEIIGHSADDVLALFNPKSHKRQNLFDTVLSEALAVKPILKYQIENQSGELYEVNCSITPIVDDEGQVRGSTGAIRIKNQITGSTSSLDPNDIVARMKFLEAMVNNNSIIGNTLSIATVEFKNIERIVTGFGQNAQIQIQEEALSTIESLLPKESVFGFIKRDKLIVAIPHKKNEDIKIEEILSTIPKTVNYFGDEIRIDNDVLYPTYDNKSLESVIEKIMQ